MESFVNCHKGSVHAEEAASSELLSNQSVARFLRKTVICNSNFLAATSKLYPNRLPQVQEISDFRHFRFQVNGLCWCNIKEGTSYMAVLCFAQQRSDCLLKKWTQTFAETF